jgi:glycosyltransferase involved in cell wall biosynthesis
MSTPGLSVLLLVGDLGFGGAENQVWHLAAGLPREGIRTRLACFGADPGRRVRLEEGGVPVDIMASGGAGWWPLHVHRRIMDLVRQHDIDLVHAFLPTFDILAPFLRVPRSRLRVVTSRRTADERLSLRDRFMMAVTSRFAQAVVANSSSVADSVRRHEKLPEHLLHVIVNGIPLPQPPRADERAAARVRLGIAPDAPVVLFLAHFRNSKGHVILPEVIQKVIALEPRTRFLVAGDMDSNTHYRSNATTFRQAIDRFGLQAAVICPGLVRDTRPLYAASDICLNLSKHEGMSNVVMEAMSMCLPVVATDAGGMEELLGDGAGGFVVPRQSTTEAAQHLGDLAGDSALRRRMGEAGRERIACHFTVDQMVHAHAELYRRLMAEHRESHGG